MKDIKNVFENISYNEEVSFKTLTSFKCGGVSSYVAYPKNIDEVIKLTNNLKKEKIDYYIFGNGTNILASDKRYDGVIIKLDKLLIYEEKEDEIKVSSGYSLIRLCTDLTRKGYKNFSFGAGIPGTIGGAVYMNAGAYGGEIKDVLVSIEVLHKGKVKTLTNKELNYGKRYSSLMEMKDVIILSATFKLEYALDLVKNVEEMLSFNEKRKESQPLEFPNAGSIFKNPEGTSSGKLIDEAGLKGYTKGNACISEKHANFIVNKGNCSSKDIIDIINYVKETIKKKNKIDLELELRLFNF